MVVLKNYIVFVGAVVKGAEVNIRITYIIKNPVRCFLTRIDSILKSELEGETFNVQINRVCEI